MVVERKLAIYKEKIKKAKNLASQYAKLDAKVEDLRDKIAGYAVWAVDNGFTLTQFYRDIRGEALGINYKSLNRWVNDRRKPIEQVIEAVEKEGKKVDKNALERIKKVISKETTPEKAKAIYDIERTKSPEDIKLDHVIKQLKDIEFFICDEVQLTLLDPVKLSEMHESIFNINETLLGFFGLPTYSKQGQRVTRVQ